MQTTEKVLNTAEGMAFGTYQAWPESPKGGLVLIHEAFGITPHIKRTCDGYATDGYAVVAPALFSALHGPNAPVYPYNINGLNEARAQIPQIPQQTVLAMVKACMDELQAKGLKVATIGYCWGGSVAYYSAAQLPGVAACVSYYGGMIEQLTTQMQPLCPTICHLAKLDRYIPVEAAQANLAQYHPAAQVYVYQADHGFNRDDGVTWDAEAAALARARTLELFDKTIS